MEPTDGIPPSLRSKIRTESDPAPWIGLWPAARSRDGDTLAAQVEALERRAIRAALAAEGHNHTRAARRLGLSRQGLLNKLDRHGLREREP